jgi:D-arabinose 1-dehydrogenase-like Zn-dependent alcohol dehydrogenase
MPQPAVSDRALPIVDDVAAAPPAAALPATEPAAPRSAERRREPARLLVTVDGSAGSTQQLIWALQEAARREAKVLAVAVLGDEADEATRAATRTLIDAEVRYAAEQTGVHGLARTALVDPLVYDALTAATVGGDLVVIRPHRKTVLRPAVPRAPVRRPLTRCG